MDRVTIAGRAFVLVGQSTIAHDLHTMALVRRGRLEEDLAPVAGDDPDSIARRVLARAAETGVALELLGALFLPEGTPPAAWTPELARETARFLGAVSDPADKAVVHGLIASALGDFLRAALLSSRPSGGALKATVGERPGAGAPAPVPSVNGHRSFGSWLRKITTTPSG